MKIRVYGFTLELGLGITKEDFFEYLIKIGPTKLADNRILAITECDEYYAGIVLSIRDTKQFCSIQQDSQGRFVITAELLEEGRNPVDFNFFIIEKQHLRGLYQHYHQSGSINTTCWILKKQYDILKQKLLEDKLTQATDEKSRRRIKRSFKGSLSYTVLLRGGTFEEHIEKLERIKKLECQFSEISSVPRAFRPLAAQAKRVVHKYTFSQKGNFAAIKDATIELVKDRFFKTAKIIGVDPDNNEQVYSLLNDYDRFGEYDYDELVGGLTIDSSKLVETVQECSIIKNLIKLAKSNGVKQILELAADD